MTGNDQYEDSFGKFTLNDVPSGIELYDAIRCHLWGIQKGYFRVSYALSNPNSLAYRVHIRSRIMAFGGIGSRSKDFTKFSEIPRRTTRRMEEVLQGSHL